MTEHGIKLLAYSPRPLDVLAKMLGGKAAEAEALRHDIEPDAAGRLRTAEQDVALLEAERDDRILIEALMPLTGDPRTLPDEWDALPLAARHAICRRILSVTIDLGRGTGRVHAVDLLDA